MKSIQSLFVIMICLLISIADAQTILKKSVISNGGQLISNNAYNLNLTIGQTFIAQSNSSTKEACLGFWYEVKVLNSIPFVLEKYNGQEKIIIKKNSKGSDLKIYPNPFFDKTKIEFEIAEQGRIRLTLIDIQGREIDVLLDEAMSEGRYKINYQPKSMLSGVYTLVLNTERERLYKSCIVLK